MTKNSLLFILLFITGCAENPPANPFEIPEHSARSFPVRRSESAVLENRNYRKPATTIINFIGSVTSKKANELTSYIHKEMNNGIRHFIININSYGGETDAGISVYQYLKSLPITITTNNTGSVQSSAAIIYCSGSKRYSLPYSVFMLHGSATTYTGGMSLSTIESLAKLNKIRLKSFTDIFGRCSGMKTENMENYFSSSEAHYFTAVEAKDMGLVQELTAPPLVMPAQIYNIAD